MEIQRLTLWDGVNVWLTAVEDRAQRHQIGHRLCEAVAGSPLRFTPAGKPYLSDGPEVSISHSGGLAACAAAPVPVGIDIERARRVSPQLLARARRAGFDGAEGDFLCWWTAREANGKRLGQGFTWSPLPPAAHCRQGTLEHEGETYYYSVCW